MEPQARALIEDFSTNAARRSGLPDAERSEARLELSSHLYDAARAEAQAAGAPVVSAEHASAAIRKVGSEGAVDEAFFAGRRAQMERAPFTPRVFAYVLDMLVLFVVGSALFFPLAFILWILHPFVIVGALAAFEVMLGQTPGKMILKLRTTTKKGGPLGWREGILRNITKANPVLVGIDALVGHLSDRAARERISDRFAETMVVREVH